MSRSWWLSGRVGARDWKRGARAPRHQSGEVRCAEGETEGKGRPLVARRQGARRPGPSPARSHRTFPGKPRRPAHAGAGSGHPHCHDPGARRAGHHEGRSPCRGRVPRWPARLPLDELAPRIRRPRPARRASWSSGSAGAARSSGYVAVDNPWFVRRYLPLPGMKSSTVASTPTTGHLASDGGVWQGHLAMASVPRIAVQRDCGSGRTPGRRMRRRGTPRPGRSGAQGW